MLKLAYGMLFSFNLIAVILHTIGLTLLLKSRSQWQSETHILLAISITELLYGCGGALISVHVLIYNTFDSNFYATLALLLNTTAITAFYGFVMLLTVNRFVKCYLNIRYPIYCTSRKINIAIVMIGVLSLTYFVIAYTLLLHTEMTMPQYSGIVYNKVLPSIDVFFILISSGMYVYIFRIYRMQKRRVPKISSSVGVLHIDSSKDIPIKDGKSPKIVLHVPFLIILTFITLMLIPNLLKKAFTAKENKTALISVFVLQTSNLWSDAFILIYFSEPVKRILKNYRRRRISQKQIKMPIQHYATAVIHIKELLPQAE